MVNVLITGATGFLGRYILSELEKEDLDIELLRLYVRTPSKATDIESNKYSIEIFQGDLSNFDKLRQATENIDVVFHVAALYDTKSKYKQFKLINVDATEALVNAMKPGSTLILTSTYGVYGFEMKPEDVVTEEYEPKKPFWHYQVTKKMQENLCFELGSKRQIKVLALRPPTIFGPGDYFFVPTFIGNLKRKLVMFLKMGGNNLLPFAHVEDVARAHVLLFQKRDDLESQPFNVKSFDATFRELTNTFTEELGMKPVRMRFLYSLAYLTGWLGEYLRFIPMTRFTVKFISSYTNLDISRITNLGYTPKYDLKETVKQSVEWYNQVKPNVRA